MEFSDVVVFFRENYYHHKGIVPVTVTTATALSKKQLQSAEKFVGLHMEEGQKPVFTENV